MDPDPSNPIPALLNMIPDPDQTKLNRNTSTWKASMQRSALGDRNFPQIGVDYPLFRGSLPFLHSFLRSWEQRTATLNSLYLSICSIFRPIDRSIDLSLLHVRAESGDSTPFEIPRYFTDSMLVLGNKEMHYGYPFSQGQVKKEQPMIPGLGFCGVKFPCPRHCYGLFELHSFFLGFWKYVCRIFFHPSLKSPTLPSPFSFFAGRIGWMLEMDGIPIACPRHSLAYREYRLMVTQSIKGIHFSCFLCSLTLQSGSCYCCLLMPKLLQTCPL